MGKVLEFRNKIWRYRSSGGRFKVMGIAEGVGTLNGDKVVFYQAVDAKNQLVEGQLYARAYSEWLDLMKPE
jgi:transposase-like protein